MDGTVVTEMAMVTATESRLSPPPPPTGMTGTTETEMATRMASLPSHLLLQTGTTGTMETVTEMVTATVTRLQMLLLAQHTPQLLLLLGSLNYQLKS